MQKLDYCARSTWRLGSVWAEKPLSCFQTSERTRLLISPGTYRKLAEWMRGQMFEEQVMPPSFRTLCGSTCPHSAYHLFQALLATGETYLKCSLTTLQRTALRGSAGRRSSFAEPLSSHSSNAGPGTQTQVSKIYPLDSQFSLPPRVTSIPEQAVYIFETLNRSK